MTCCDPPDGGTSEISPEALGAQDSPKPTASAEQQSFERALVNGGGLRSSGCFQCFRILVGGLGENRVK